MGLFNYFTDLFISDVIGYEKPDSEFFSACLSQDKLATDEILFIGDSLTADIMGATNYGIDACWYNSNRLSNDIDCDIRYTIESLSQLREIL